MFGSHGDTGTELTSTLFEKQQPAWDRSRDFEVTTRLDGRNQLCQRATGDLDEEEMAGGEYEVGHHIRHRKVTLMASPGA